MKIYLAIPYSGHENLSFIKANRMAGRLIADGHIVYSPISMSHPIATQNDMPDKWDFWLKQDTEFIRWCDELWVIMMPGYRKSVGVNAEIEIAFKLKKPIKYKPPIYINKDKIFLTWKEFKEPPFEWRPGRFGIAKKQLLERGFIKRIHQGGSCKKDKSIYGESDDWRRWVKGMDFSPKPDVKRGYQGAFNCNLIQNTHGKIRAIHTREKKSLDREFG